MNLRITNQTNTLIHFEIISKKLSPLISSFQQNRRT
jgi:hypothetical protein